ncbi:MAG TPA: four helix bundle protein [Candidatus Nanoarchaeia archaeon]
MANKFKTPEEVPVFVKAHELVLEVYRVTKEFPKSEIFGLMSQLRRSAASIPANISEGFYRHTTRELIQFLYNSRGSVGESLYHLKLSFDLGYIEQKDYLKLKESFDEVGKQLNGWIKSLKIRLNH